MNIDYIRRLTSHYNRFDDGRIDYTHEKVCYVLNCVVVFGNKILLTRRGADVIAYPNTLNGISGFIDSTDLSLEEIARKELSEELQMPMTIVKSIKISQPFVQIDERINREWHVFAVLVEVNEEFEPITNWENKSAMWYNIDESKSLELMPGFAETMHTALALRQ